MRGTHTLTSILARFLARFRVFKGNDNPYYGIRIPPKLKKLWILLEFVSVLPVVLLRYLLPLILRKIVVGDRFTVDFVVWILMEVDDTKFLLSMLSRFMLALALKYRGVYIYAEPKVLYARKSDTPYKKLVFQCIAYRKIAEMLSSPEINTSGKSISESFHELLKIVRAYFPSSSTHVFVK